MTIDEHMRIRITLVSCGCVLLLHAFTFCIHGTSQESNTQYLSGIKITNSSEE